MDPPKKMSKAERIAIRAQRIEHQRNREEMKQKGIPQTLSNQPPPLLSKTVLATSRQAVDDALNRAVQVVSDIKLDREDKERIRREKEQVAQVDRARRMDEELELNRALNEQIEQQWEQVAARTLPQELYAGIAEQYKLATTLLHRKDELIRHFQAELKAKDEEYVELLNNYQDDVSLTVGKMHDEFDAFEKKCQEELLRLEQVFIQERKELLERNQSVMDSLFAKRKQVEMSLLDTHSTRTRKHQQEIDALRQRDEEDYHALKVELEKSIQAFEQQLEEMRVMYMMNAEKLEYNHAVLMERDVENRRSVEWGRVKVRRMKEVLSNMMARCAREEEKMREENMKITEGYRAMTEQFKDLQRKYAHFVALDTQKYNQIYDMNTQIVLSLIHKLLHADKIIQTQLLGWDWRSPFGNHDDAFSVTVEDVAKMARGETGKEEEEKEGPTKGVTAGTGKFTVDQIKMVMDLLVSEVTFLIDGHLQETLQALETDEEKHMFKADGILSAVGVEDQEDLEELVSYFFQDASSPHPSVHPNDVAKVVRAFILHRQSKSNSSSSAVSAKSNVANEKRARRKERERRFWETMGNVLPSKTLEVWKALENWQHKYNGLLQKRATLLDETAALAQQNDELKRLLQQYMRSSVNHELQLPPTQFIRVQHTPDGVNAVPVSTLPR